MRSINGIKPQDILILLKILLWEDRPNWQSVDLAQELGLSPFEISIGLNRCRSSHFLDTSKRKLMKSALLEFILHGLKYVYPVQPGSVGRGMPTAHSAQPLAKKIVSNDIDNYVWPDSEGTMRGQAIEPVYKTAPLAAKKDPRMHEVLALIDAIRVGRTREQIIASRELTRRFKVA